MSFLPFPGDDELSPAAAAALATAQLSRPGPVSNLDRTLLGSGPVFEAYLGWFSVRDEVVPYIGERATDLFALAISRAAAAPYPVAYFERAHAVAGGDPADPVVTEAEGLLIEWGTAIGAGDQISAELSGRVEQTFQPKLRLALVAFAGLMMSVCVFTRVGQVPAEQVPAPQTPPTQVPPTRVHPTQ